MSVSSQPVVLELGRGYAGVFLSANCHLEGEVGLLLTDPLTEGNIQPYFRCSVKKQIVIMGFGTLPMHNFFGLLRLIHY